MKNPDNKTKSPVSLLIIEELQKTLSPYLGQERATSQPLDLYLMHDQIHQNSPSFALIFKSSCLSHTTQCYSERAHHK